MTPLSQHFALEELTVTLHKEIDNTAPPEIVETLRDTAAHMEMVRSLLGGRFITVSSGYRCPELNKAVGGAADSAHMTGHACDFNCFGVGSPLEICRVLAKSGLDWDQMIQEGTWVHLSFDPRMRREILTKKPGGGYVHGLPET